jgi:uncharacterized protein with NRDE domain
MCLILVAWRRHAGFPLVVAANRDEYHARPAAGAAYWRDAPGILAGRDLQANGTWLGVARNGRFAAVTNVRGGLDPNAEQSRGALVSGFLAGSATPARYVADLDGRRSGFSGFNLLVADGEEFWWLSNRADGPRRLGPGCYALGNELLDSPEVREIKERFAAAPCAVDPLFSLLAEAKIVAAGYGTRCSTVVLQEAGGTVQFAERPFDAAGADGATLRYEFRRAA